MLIHEIGVLSDLNNRSIWTLIYLNRFHLGVETLEHRSVPLSPLILLMVCWAREGVFGGRSSSGIISSARWNHVPSKIASVLKLEIMLSDLTTKLIKDSCYT